VVDSALPSDFEEIKDRADALKLLREGAKTLASVMIWIKEQSLVLHSHITVFSDSTGTFYCMSPKGYVVEEFETALQQTGTSDCYFSVSLQRANIFFKSPYRLTDAAGLQFGWPERVFKVQRRKYLRFPLPDGHLLRVSIQDPLNPDARLSMKVIDLSAGGLAFLADDVDAPVFFQGLKLSQISLTVRGRPITVDAVVRHKRELKNHPRHKGWSIGVEFEGMKEADGQVLAAYVFEESRKFFSKYI
jgi:hypothetical protein